MSKVCRAADAAGIGTAAIVKAAGGDACTEDVLDPVFKVVYVGRGKWMNPEVLTKGFNLLKRLAAERAAGKTAKTEKPAGKPADKPVVADVANALKAVVKK